MASINRPFRPEMDWTVDADLPHRFKLWKRQVRNEIRLQMAQDSNKGETYACMFVLVSAGEAGEDVIAKGGLYGESKDYTKLIKCLEESVTPSTHYIEDCINYFFCKQGDMSIRQYQSEAERLIERMIPAYNATSTITHLDLKKFLLRNLLLVGFKDKNVLKDCQKLQQKDCTVESIIDLALQAEFRETTNARISKTINSSHQSSALQDVMNMASLAELLNQLTYHTMLPSTSKIDPAAETGEKEDGKGEERHYGGLQQTSKAVQRAEPTWCNWIPITLNGNRLPSPEHRMKSNPAAMKCSCPLVQLTAATGNSFALI
ncbi:hypothetical protein CAPTEDRAFT_205763 [Capitella teleta]|uniref:Retrotransposon gag domain-containing protein n=1 Tax=Capitella teleta TaxID=283909 RepID=R7TQM9_CAPTE|nr:hypothetical protein CAPTEDRAFT_205763 [Capitella teleta]|eukprot:ELT93320.1 hypothetical protein CAPTEDRAFT_205763 [Capitella teleta]